MSGFNQLFSGDRRPVLSLPADQRLAALIARLNAVRTPLAHEGINAVVAVYKIGRPKSLSDYYALLGLVGMLSNPDLSDRDIENLARDILDHWPSVVALLEV